jgi:hypothetical protein
MKKSPSLDVLANDEHVIAVINVALASPTHRVDDLHRPPAQ